MYAQKKNAVAVLDKPTPRKRDVFSLNDKLSIQQKFHRHRFAAKLNQKTLRFNPL
jgi:hypothetical protein